MSVIRLRRSSTPGAVPSAGALVQGELAINLVDNKAYYKDQADAVKLLAPTPTGGGASGTWPISVSGNANTATALTTGDKTIDGSITIGGVGRRIYGDFSNANQANRLTFVNSTANSSTYPQAAPSGTGTASGFLFANSSDLANCGFGLFNATNLYVAFTSGKLGSGAALPFKVFVGGLECVSLDTSGRQALPYAHNNASGMNGSTPMVGSGTYTPTLTPTLYISSATAYTTKWTRVGNVVRVSGYVQINFMSGYTGSIAQLKISLPVTSNLAQSYDLSGQCNYLDRNYPGGGICAHTADDVALLQIPIQSTGVVLQVMYDFSYEVL